jgi:hypothetical protein
MFPTDNFVWECTECDHAEHEYQDPNAPSIPPTKHCSKCGAEMTGHFRIKGGPVAEHPFRRE